MVTLNHYLIALEKRIEWKSRSRKESTAKAFVFSHLICCKTMKICRRKNCYRKQCSPGFYAYSQSQYYNGSRNTTTFAIRATTGQMMSRSLRKR